MDGVTVARIFLSPVPPQDRAWMWASWPLGHIRRAAHGYAETREAEMAASPRAGGGNRHWSLISVIAVLAGNEHAAALIPTATHLSLMRSFAAVVVFNSSNDPCHATTGADLLIISVR
jgi:hypothetical protein